MAPQKSQLGLDEIPFSPTTFEILLPDRGFYMEPTELFLVGSWTRGRRLEKPRKCSPNGVGCARGMVVTAPRKLQMCVVSRKNATISRSRLILLEIGSVLSQQMAARGALVSVTATRPQERR